MLSCSGENENDKKEKKDKKKTYKDILREQLLTHGADIATGS